MAKMRTTELLLSAMSSLTNEQWSVISSSSGLPSEARAEVERAIDLYRLSAVGQTPAALRKELSNLKIKVLIVRKELAELSATPQGAVALALALRSETKKALDPAMARRTATNVITKLDLLAEWLARAERSVKKGQPGARQTSLRIKLFVVFLDDILFRFKRKRISRSSKRNSSVDYIRAACAAADISISDASIDEAMKQIIKTRRKIDSGKIAPLSPKH
jgi:hypothetical protein